VTRIAIRAGGKVQYDPAFIGTHVQAARDPTSTGRYGIAGWVSPMTPVGPPSLGWGESNGVPASASPSHGRASARPPSGSQALTR